MKIDPSDYLTVAEAAKAIGADNKRAVYRAVARARNDGEETTISAFGRTLIPKAAVETLKAYYFPLGSEQRHEIAVFYGGLGGSQKKKNSQKQAIGAARPDDLEGAEKPGQPHDAES